MKNKRYLILSTFSLVKSDPALLEVSGKIPVDSVEVALLHRNDSTWLLRSTSEEQTIPAHYHSGCTGGSYTVPHNLQPQNISKA